MSKPTSVGCFFLDTCIILSDILKENTARIEKFKKNVSFHSISCYITDSVKQEICKKVQETSDFLGNTVRETIRYHLEESRRRRNISLKDPMTSEDIKALEDLFAYYHNAVRTTKVALPSPVELIEEWTISFLGEKLDEGVAITIEGFLKALVKKILELTSYIEDLYDDIVTFQKSFVKIKTVTLDSRIVGELQDLGLHKPDCEHIAGAVIHQTETKEKTVFVTLDFNSILCKRDLIRKQFDIECCDPLYALHHLI